MNELIPLRIVVVEHRAAVRRSVCDLLTAMGHVATGASGLEEALLASAPGCDVLLADASLPPTGGLVVLDQVRDRHPYALCVLMSGGELEQLQRRGLWKTSVPFVDKPVTRAALQRIISRARPARITA